MKTWVLAGVLAVVALGASAVAGSFFWDWGRYPYATAASTIAPDVDLLYRVIGWITTGMFLLVWGLLAIFLVRYRRRPGVKSHYSHGDRASEIAWTVIPAAMLVGLALWQLPAWAKAKRYFPTPNVSDADTGKPPIVLQTVAQQFEWNFRFNPADNEFDFKNALDLEDPETTAPIGEPIGPKTVFVAVNRKVLVTLSSADVIHSLFIPNMRVKQDAVPGMNVKVWFEPNRFQVFDLQTQQPEWVSSEEEFQRKFTAARVAFIGFNQEYDPKTRAFRCVAGAPTADILHLGRVLLDQPPSTATHALGIFEIACAELCGTQHYKMRSRLWVGTQKMYEAWLARQTEYEMPPIWSRWVDRKPAWD